MTDMRNSAPVVAGIDGSPTAVRAALWAADEAESLGAPLRLVYATKRAHQRAGEYAEDVRRGHSALRQPVLLSVGRNEAGQLAQIVGDGHPAFHHSASSA